MVSGYHEWGVIISSEDQTQVALAMKRDSPGD